MSPMTQRSRGDKGRRGQHPLDPEDWKGFLAGVGMKVGWRRGSTKGHGWGWKQRLNPTRGPCVCEDESTGDSDVQSIRDPRAHLWRIEGMPAPTLGRGLVGLLHVASQSPQIRTQPSRSRQHVPARWPQGSRLVLTFGEMSAPSRATTDPCCGGPPSVKSFLPSGTRVRIAYLTDTRPQISKQDRNFMEAGGIRRLFPSDREGMRG